MGVSYLTGIARILARIVVILVRFSPFHIRIGAICGHASNIQTALGHLIGVRAIKQCSHSAASVDMNDNTIEQGFPHLATRFSWLCGTAVVATAIINNRSAAPLQTKFIVEMVCLGVMSLGMLLAVIGLCGIPKYGIRGLLGRSVGCLLLNGSLLYFFLTNFFGLRQSAGQ